MGHEKTPLSPVQKVLGVAFWLAMLVGAVFVYFQLPESDAPPPAETLAQDIEPRQLSDAEVQALGILLQEEDPDIRKQAVIDLGKSGNDLAVQFLVDALNDTDSFVADWAAQMLGQIGDTRAVEPLIHMLETSYRKHEVARALGRIGGVRAVGPLIRAMGATEVGLGGTGRRYQNMAADALVEIGDPSVDPLISALSESDMTADARWGAVEALGKIGDRRAAIGVLIEALRDSDWEVRLSAARSIERFGDGSALDGMANVLVDREVGPIAARFLNGCGWSPATTTNRVHYWIATRDQGGLHSNRELVITTLRDGLDSEDRILVEGSASAVVDCGLDELVPQMIEILPSKPYLVSAYLNSNQDELVAAARDWASSNGYRVMQTQTSGRHPSWGGS